MKTIARPAAAIAAVTLVLSLLVIVPAQAVNESDWSRLDADGDWVIVPASAAGSRMQPAWNVGVCTGTFHMPRKVGSVLEWGGQNSCSGTASVYLHSIRVQLRETCIGPFCIKFENLWAYTSPSSKNYSRVVNVTVDSACIKSDGRRYDLVATVTLRSNQYRFNSRPVDVTNCNVHPPEGGV